MFKVRSENDAMTERSPAYAILAIDSEDRFKNYEEARLSVLKGYNDTPYNFQITKNESMMNGFFTRLALTELCFPWAISNMNKKTNKILMNWSLTGVPQPQVTLTLSVGFRRPAEIAADMISQIQAQTGNFPTATFTYGDDNLPRFSFIFNDPALQASFSPLPYNSVVYPYPNTTKQLYDLLGFDVSLVGDATTYKSSSLAGGFTFCQAYRYVDIVCNQLTYNQALKDTMSQTVARDTLCRLYVGDGPYTGTSTLSPSDPLFCPPGCAPFVIYRQYTNPKFIRWLPNQPVQGNLQFSVYDDTGELFGDLGPLANALDQRELAANWSMTLLVSED